METQHHKTQFSTAAINVHILHESFWMPELDRSRRIWIYLPPDYALSNQNYPVLYLQDGQNIFDEANSYAGEWAVDKTLNHLFREGKSNGLIVVGIDNGGKYRSYEYSPWKRPHMGGGDGLKYVKFITKTLKPFIDKSFRTLVSHEHTGIMGSSMGAFLALYAGLRYPKVFGRVGVFSPSLWFAPEMYELAESYNKTENSKFYFLAGEQESLRMVPDTQKMIDIFQKKGFNSDELKFKIKHDGTHSEWFWRHEFGEAYTWLFT